MGNYFVITLLGGAVILAAIVLLTASPALSKRLTAAAGVIAAVGGLLVHGYGFITVEGSIAVAALRTLFAVCCMFIGESDFSAISDAPLFHNAWAAGLYWGMLLLAFYSTSSAAISVFGAKALKSARLWLSQWKDVALIYGVNEDSVEFGRELLGCGEEMVVYIGEDPDASLADIIDDSGCVLRTDHRAINAHSSFLSGIGLGKGKRKITLYALSKDSAQNSCYAKALLQTLENAQIAPERISLVIHAGEDDEAVKKLQVSPECYGYGFVTVFQEHSLVARLLIQKYPPCRHIRFDGAGKAQEDFEAVVVGFGQLGQAILRNIVMNGQFVGSTFRAAVFAPDCGEVSGFFVNAYKGILENYDVTFHSHDGRSEQMYAHLAARKDTIKYIVVSTGSEQRDAEIARELCAFIGRMGRQIPVYQCSYRGVKITGQEAQVHKVYDPGVLSMKNIDKMAMVVNQYYQGERSRGALNDWLACDYFSRMSCRAYADFIEAVLRASGKTREMALADQWSFTAEELETMGRMEHLRWNAFHFCMGFMTMSQEEYAQRTRIYQQQLQRDGKGSIRIGKNLDNRTHACLIPWEALDALSEKENRITGGHVNYKQMDIDNVLLLPTLLRIHEGLQQE